MSSHTPGPWFWPYGNTLAAGAHGDPDGEWTLVAAIHDSDEISPADARLIAAAPDLLAVAKAIYPSIVAGDLYGLSHDASVALLGQLRQAIAKAEGRKP